MEKLLNYVGKLKEDKDCFYKVCLYRILSSLNFLSLIIFLSKNIIFLLV